MTHRYTPSATWLRHLNQRQLKKLRLGEFQEFGVHLTLNFAPALDEAQHVSFTNAAIDMLEASGLVIAGLGGGYPLAQTEAFICCEGRGSVSDVQQQAVITWFEAQPTVQSVKAERLDSWYGW
jgi:uncharacterized protein